MRRLPADVTASLNSLVGPLMALLQPTPSFVTRDPESRHFAHSTPNVSNQPPQTRSQDPGPSGQTSRPLEAPQPAPNSSGLAYEHTSVGGVLNGTNDTQPRTSAQTSRRASPSGHATRFHPQTPSRFVATPTPVARHPPPSNTSIQAVALNASSPNGDPQILLSPHAPSGEVNPNAYDHPSNIPSAEHRPHNHPGQPPRDHVSCTCGTPHPHANPNNANCPPDTGRGFFDAAQLQALNNIAQSTATSAQVQGAMMAMMQTQMQMQAQTQWQNQWNQYWWHMWHMGARAWQAANPNPNPQLQPQPQPQEHWYGGPWLRHGLYTEEQLNRIAGARAPAVVAA
ncbi:hypothetical protein MIND_01389000 [Mycena indigotica]|uniref:Uncharacterized protein n=1 Tax=Mycena indigotica TaxID=2126181 RepID=A0A8H6VPU8_9AGAR|nr:uncharacterized protein MIND_01389000 [Mycena indigotica]KAF7289274.1 hypothetical protein MIND_01389000 [Mycena indigotica]